MFPFLHIPTYLSGWPTKLSLQVIALLITTLSFMPLKSLNKQWDEMDPNMTIPENSSKTATENEPREHVGHDETKSKAKGDTRHIEIV